MIAAALLLAGAAAAATPAQDVADVSTRVCYNLAAGTLTLANGDTDAQTRVLATTGVVFGLDQIAYGGLGQLGTAMVAQSIMGMRANGSARAVVAIGGRMQGCRTMLVGDASATLYADIEAALAAAGWRKVPTLTSVSGMGERRVFLRRDAANRPYLLNLNLLSLAATMSSRLRLFTSVAAVPPTVRIPEGF